MCCCPAFSDPVVLRSRRKENVVRLPARLRACSGCLIESQPLCEVKSSNNTYTTKLTRLVAASERSSETPRAVLPSCGCLLVSYWPLAPASAERESAQELVSCRLCIASTAAANSALSRARAAAPQQTTQQASQEQRPRHERCNPSHRCALRLTSPYRRPPPAAFAQKTHQNVR